MKKYSTEDALKVVFDSISPSAIGKPAYDKLLVYKKRFQDGKLGRRAIDKILSEYGFNKHETIFYTKEEK